MTIFLSEDGLNKHKTNFVNPVLSIKDQTKTSPHRFTKFWFANERKTNNELEKTNEKERTRKRTKKKYIDKIYTDKKKMKNTCME